MAQQGALQARQKKEVMFSPQLLFSVGISVATIAVGWGVLTTKQQAAEAQIAEIKQNTASKEKIETVLFILNVMQKDILEVRESVKDIKKTASYYKRR